MGTLARNVLSGKRVTQSVFASCSNSTAETPEECMNLVKANNKSSDVVLVSLWFTFNLVRSVYLFVIKKGEIEALKHFKNVIKICPNRGHIFRKKNTEYVDGDTQNIKNFNSTSPLNG